VPGELKAPKFDILARGHLQRGLRNHPDAAQHVASPEAIDRLPMRSLLALAKKLGVDAPAMIEKVRAEDQERWRYTEQNPAFRGTLEFDLSVELLGSRVTRKARAEYTFTPEWPYYDKKKRAPYEGWPGSTIQLSILTVQEKEGHVGPPTWESIDLLEIGELWDAIDDAIEARCKVEDAERRRAATAPQAQVKPRSRKHH